jgi:hypothetical protein
MHADGRNKHPQGEDGALPLMDEGRKRGELWPTILASLHVQTDRFGGPNERNY